MPRYGNEANFSSFLTSQALTCRISQNIQAKPCGFIRDIHVLMLLGDLKESPSLGESSHVTFGQMAKYSSLTVLHIFRKKAKSYRG